MSLEEAASRVEDGMRIALGGLAVNQRPMAFVRELVRQGRRGLTVIGSLNSIETDMLVGAGCVAAVETSYVGLEEFGLAPNFRRAVQGGAVSVVDFSELLQFDRFRANQDGLTFALSTALAGTDVVRHNGQVRQLVCPFTGRRYQAVPPANADVVVVHASAADEYGNVLVPWRRLLPQNLDLVMTRGCDTVLVTVERIVSNAVVRRNPDLNQIPAFRTTGLVEAPWGAHPGAMQGYYDVDRSHFREYVEASGSSEAFAAYLRRYVTGPGTEAGYLEEVGLASLAALNAGIGDAW